MAGLVLLLKMTWEMLHHVDVEKSKLASKTPWYRLSFVK